MSLYRGRDGSSKDKAVIILGANTAREAIDVEYNYIESKVGYFEIGSQTCVDDGDKKYDNMNISYALNGNKKELWFDITDFYGRGDDV